MIIISHRGNLQGPDLKTENTKSQIYKCLDLGFDVEIDIRVIDGKIMLGHDTPCEEIPLKDLYKIRDRLWIHCKNLEALEYFCKKSFNYFWHETDRYTITSKGIGWVLVGQYPYSKSVIVLPESISLYSAPHGIEYIKSSYGICTDTPVYYKELLK